GVELLSDRADRLRIRGYIPRRITICLWSESVKRLRLTRGSSGPQSVPSCRTGGKACYEEAARRPLSRRVVRRRTGSAMIAFEVSLNRKRVCTAGVPDFGVLSAILSWVRRRPDQSRGGKTIEEELTAEVGGLHSEVSG